MSIPETSPAADRRQTAIARGLVHLVRDTYGKGPDQCRVHILEDLVVATLSGGLTAAERTLADAGCWHDVREVRRAWHEAVEPALRALVEDVMCRTVQACMAADHHEPDVRLMAFVLGDPDGPPSPSASSR